MSDIADHNADTGRRGKARPRRPLLLALTGAGATVGLLALAPATPRLIWNYTPSVPMGLYTVAQETFSRGDLVVIDLKGNPRRLLESAGALKPGHFLIKPVAAMTGDVVCREAANITINEIPVARARTLTPSGIPLPAWSGCRKLSGDEILLIADHPASFDSRYFGPLPVSDVVGVARPLALLPSLQEGR